MDLRKFKPTGIVRRIDDLGRIVIPKDYRSKCGVEIGTPYEIFVEKETKRILLIPYNEEEPTE